MLFRSNWIQKVRDGKSRKRERIEKLKTENKGSVLHEGQWYRVEPVPGHDCDGKVTVDEKERTIIEKFYDGIISDLRKKEEEKIRIWKEKKKKAHTSQYVEVREKYRKEVEKHEEKILEIQDSNFEELNDYFETKQRRVGEIENQYKLKTRLLLYSAALVIIK